MCVCCTPLIKAIDNYIAKADEDLSKALKKSGFVDPDGTVEEIESLEDEVAEVLVAETDYFVEALKSSVDLETFFAESWPKVKADNPSAKQLFKVFWDEFEGYMKPIASKYIAKTDAALTVKQISNRTTAWIESWSQKLSDLMKLDSETQIESILRTAMDEGQSVAQVTQAILDSGIRDEYYRARRVAITEVLRAHSVASQEAMMQSPAVEEKEWRHTGAYRNSPRQNHVDMNGVKVPKGEAFTLEGADGETYYPMFPRDSSLPPGESVNCHCIAQAIVSDEILGLPLEERKRLQAEAVAEMDEAWEAELDAKNKAAAGLGKE